MKPDKRTQLIVLVAEELKEKYHIRCVRQKTNMSIEIVRFIKEYVERED